MEQVNAREFRDVLSAQQPQSQENTTTSSEGAESDSESAESKRKIEDSKAQALGGLRALQTYTADRFKVTEANGDAYAACAGFERAKHNLYLHGPTGAGKSHLAAIAARRWLHRPWEVMTKNPAQIMREVRAADGAQAEQAVIDHIAKSPVLVLEDLGVAKDTEFAVSTLYEIVNWRYMNRPGGLIVTSNLGLGELAIKLGEDRITSRLAGVCQVFALHGEPDRRLEQGL